MELTGEYRLDASKDIVWNALNDRTVLERCIPGCKELKQKSTNEFEANVAVKIGPFSATFIGNVALENLDPPNGYNIIGQGNGGVAGFARGMAVVKLDEVDGVTTLTYETKAEVVGKIASLGGRLITATSKKLAEKFFASLVREVSFNKRIYNDGAEGDAI